MTYHPYPRVDRARHQLDRHGEEWCPPGPIREPLPLPAWFFPPERHSVKVTPEQAAALVALPDAMRRWSEALQRSAAAVIVGFAEGSTWRLV